ncbi:MAG: hypothetical protein KDB14_05635, partial [Planctomycetales bacterium]|nr:hypothetical protein [Planctomycetales bacterium]
MVRSELDTVELGPVEAVIESESREVIRFRELEWNLAEVKLRTNTAGWSHSTVACSPGCVTGETCVDGRCLLLCTEDWQCHGQPFDSNWTCWNENAGFIGMCIGPLTGTCASCPPTPTIAVYDSNGGWASAGYPYYHLFAEAKTATDTLNAWIHDPTNGLGINSWDDAGSPLRMSYKIDHLDFIAAPGDVGVTASGASWSSTNGMSMYNASPAPRVGDDAWAGLLEVFGHEFGHGITHAADFRYNPNECSDEIHAAIHGVLFSSNSYPLHTFVYPGPAEQRWVIDERPCELTFQTASPWTGVACGGAGDCGPWDVCAAHAGQLECSDHTETHNNLDIWKRFATIWARGTDALLADGLGESMGYAFAGAGLGLATGIYSDVVQAAPLDETSTLQDFAFALVAFSGAAAAETRAALGAVGMYDGESSLNRGSATDSSVVGAVFPAWALAQDHRFYAWRDATNGNIVLRFTSATGTNIIAWEADAGSAPVLAVYHDRLHVFWRDALSSGIKFRTVKPDGKKSRTHDLTGLDIRTTGDFDAVAFNDYLYLIYVHPNGPSQTPGGVHISKCKRDTYGCTAAAADWTEWGLGQKYKYLGFGAQPGMAADVGAGLNGLAAAEATEEFLYIAFAGASTQNDERIGLKRIDAADLVG